MISADLLKQIVAVLKDGDVTGFRYKNGDEEVEIAIVPKVDDDGESPKDYTSTNAVGFHVRSFDDMEEIDGD